MCNTILVLHTGKLCLVMLLYEQMLIISRMRMITITIAKIAPPHNEPAKKKKNSSLSSTHIRGTITISRISAIKIFKRVPIFVSFIIMVQIYEIVLKKANLFFIIFCLIFCCRNCWGNL